MAAIVHELLCDQDADRVTGVHETKGSMEAMLRTILSA